MTERPSWPPPALEQVAVLGPRVAEAIERDEVDEVAPLWTVFVSGLAHIALAAVLWALVWATIPRLFGWQPTVITGGSMQPTIALGDIVVTRPVDVKGLVPGAVVTFEDPTGPGRLITHRIVEVTGSGVIRTRGDNNPSNDTQLVSPSAVQGRAVVRIPYLGRPLIWMQQHEYVLVLAAVLLMLGLVWVVATFPL